MQKAVSDTKPNRPDRRGAKHAWRMHLTTWLLLALTPFALGLFIWLAGKDHERVVETLRYPYVALPLVFTLLVGVWHMALGMRMILEDYIRGQGLLRALLGLNTLFAVAVLVLSVWAVMQLMLGL